MLTANAVTISNAILCKSATYKGTRYIPGQYVALGKDKFDLIVGNVLLVAVFRKRLYFVIKKMVANFQFRLGIYCLMPAEAQLACAEINNLCDYYPLYAYKSAHNHEYLVVKHAVREIQKLHVSYR